ncbi:glycosyltransferase [Kocuria sp.]|uniref:glycosyltransferase n=1 Tax=Kocuria sp. TaxID=1871328 RepID=UPI0026DFF8BC|nr:glycosyltransferase [Kocuria sp.]MDO5617808.1 hypothetical protein [Kocuria sp.]
MNPYQALLYRSFGDHGFAVAPLLKSFEFRDLLLHKSRTSSITLHLHWVNWVLAGEANAQRAASKVQGILGRIDQFKAKGGHLVWTAHNVYPHDAAHLDAELALQQGIADRSDAIHTMAASTTEALSEYTNIDSDKVVVAPHPHYRGAYEDVTSRAEARSVLGIDNDETVFLVFGALKEYKGLQRTLAGFRSLVDRDSTRRYRLLVAGAPDAHPAVQRFVEDALLDERVLIEPTKIPGSKAQYFLRAADAGLVTYTRSLNSGAALLYQSFGLPVLATDTSVLRSTLPAETSLFLNADAMQDEYGRQLEALGDMARKTSQSRVLEAIAHLDPARISTDFAYNLRQQLGLRQL